MKNFASRPGVPRFSVAIYKSICKSRLETKVARNTTSILEHVVPLVFIGTLNRLLEQECDKKCVLTILLTNSTKIRDEKCKKFAQWTVSYQFKAMRNACPTSHDSQILFYRVRTNYRTSALNRIETDRIMFDTVCF